MVEAFSPVTSVSRFAARPVGGQLHLSQQGQYTIQYSRLTGAGAAGDQQQPGGRRFPDGAGLFLGIFDAALLRHVADHALQALGRGEAALRKFQQPLTAIHFRFVQPWKVVNGDARQRTAHQAVGFQQPADAFFYRFSVHAQQLADRQLQLVLREEAVSCREIVIQLKQDSGFHPPGVVPRHAQLNGEAIHRPEGRVQSLVHE